MKWIKYEYVCGTNTDGSEIIAKKRVGYSEANLTIAQSEACNGEYTIEEDDKEYPDTAVIPADADMKGNRITNLGEPINDTDAASKKTLIDYALGKDSLSFVIVSEFPDLESRNTAKYYCIPIEGSSNWYQVLYYSGGKWVTSERVYFSSSNFEIVSKSDLSKEVNLLSSDIANKVSKTGITLEQHADGLIYIFIDGVPVGSGIELGTVAAGDVMGYIDENNNILLTGALADGTYTLKYVIVDENGNESYTDIGTLEVGALPEPEPVKTNFAVPTDSEWVEGRISNGAANGIQNDVTNVYVTNYIPVQVDDVIVLSECEPYPAASNGRFAVYSGTTHSMRIYNAAYSGTDEYLPMTGDKEFTVKQSSIKYVRLTIRYTDVNLVTINIKRNGEWL